MWKTLAVAGVSLALTMPIALAQGASSNMERSAAVVRRRAKIRLAGSILE